MAEAVADNILLKIQQEAYKSKEASEHHESLSEKLSGMLMGTDDMKTAFVKAAEEEAAAQIEKSKKDDAEKKAKEEEAAAQKKRDLMAMSNFEQLGLALKSQSSKLGDALKEDFKQITGGLSLIAEAPGVKSILAIVTAIGGTLGNLLLVNIKNSGILGSAISGMIAQKEDGTIDYKATMDNVKEKFNPFSGKKDKKEKKLKADGSPDKRFSENKSFLEKMNENTNKRLKGAGEDFKKLGEGLKDPMGSLKKMSGRFTGGLKNAGKSMAGIAKSLGTAMVRVVVAAGSFIAGLAASAVSMLIAAAPLLLKAALIGLLVAGLVFIGFYVYKKFMENKDYIMAKWQQISEGFGIVMDQLVLWKDKAVTFLSNTFKSIWLGLKSLFATVMTGLENGINMVIKGINKLIPGEKYDLDPVDIGAGAMRQKVDEEKAAFEVEKAGQAEEFAAREKDIADRKASNTMDKHMGNNVIQQNTTVNEGSKDTTIVPSGTEPQDSFASNMALAQ